MIRLKGHGSYRLIETTHHAKILYLGSKVYAWVEPPSIGEMLVVSHNPHKTDCVLSIGEYRLYDVDDEPQLSDLQHLELEVGGTTWQSYLLLTGLPTDSKKRARIVPTSESITNNPQFADRKKLTKV
ncbi:MAG: hypothetical protein AAB436_01645 [Patescibacteria group bacterium]